MPLQLENDATQSNVKAKLKDHIFGMPSYLISFYFGTEDSPNYNNKNIINVTIWCYLFLLFDIYTHKLQII